MMSIWRKCAGIFFTLSVLWVVVSSVYENFLRREVFAVIGGGDYYFELVEPEPISFFYKIRPAKDFGAVMNSSFPNIELVLAKPLQSCSRLDNAGLIRGSVALILRGGCSFVSKVLQAEEAGAVAAIIMDNDIRNNQIMIDMIGDGTERDTNIPAFFMLGKDGSMIRDALEELGRQYAIVHIPLNLTGLPLNAVRQPPWTLW